MEFSFANEKNQKILKKVLTPFDKYGILIKLTRERTEKHSGQQRTMITEQ